MNETQLRVVNVGPATQEAQLQTIDQDMIQWQSWNTPNLHEEEEHEEWKQPDKRVRR